MNVLHEDYAICASCNGETHRDNMRGTHCKDCDTELGGEG
jgi:hypothetical protein